MRSTASSSPTHTEPMARAREGLAVDRVGDSALEAAQCFEGCHAGGDLASVVRGRATRISDLAAHMGKNRVTDLSVSRNKLIKKGLVYSPERELLAFTVPGTLPRCRTQAAAKSAHPFRPRRERIAA
jgi:hypothetical protein